MQSLIRPTVFLVILVAFTTVSSADETGLEYSGYFSSGIGYDSYLPSLGKDSTQRIGSIELTSDLGMNLKIYDLFAGASFFMDAFNADKWRHSLFTTMINAGWGSTFGDYDISVTAYGTFAGYDFDDFRAYYADGSFDGDIYFNHRENMSFFFSISGGYTHGFDLSLKYLRGPYAGFEIGEYFYFGEFDSFIRIHGRVNFNFFDDISISNYPYLGEKGVNSLFAKNSGVDSTAGLRGRFNTGKLYLSLTPSYRNSTMFEKDVWEYSDRIIKKRRVDHTLLFEVEPGWRPDENLTVSIYYLLEKNFSTLGRNDYTDENYIRHSVKLLINYDF